LEKKFLTSQYEELVLLARYPGLLLINKIFDRFFVKLKIFLAELKLNYIKSVSKVNSAMAPVTVKSGGEPVKEDSRKRRNDSESTPAAKVTKPALPVNI
jgi:hypothetical protein